MERSNWLNSILYWFLMVTVVWGLCYFGTQQAIAKAEKQCNHYNFGAAGKYTRIALEHNCIGITMSSHQISFGSEDMIFRATPGSLISIAIPSGKQPPLILDMGSILPYSARPFEQYPPAILRAVMQSLGGILAGIYAGVSETQVSLGIEPRSLHCHL